MVAEHRLLKHTREEFFSPPQSIDEDGDDLQVGFLPVII